MAIIPFLALAQVRRSDAPSIEIGENVVPAHVIDAPGRKPISIAWGNELIWLVDAEERVIRIIEPLRGEVVGPVIELSSLTNPGPAAFDSDNQVIWIIDNPKARAIRGDHHNTGVEPRVVRVPIQNPSQSCFFPVSLRADTGELSGIGWDGIAPWICMRGGLCAALYRVDLSQDYGLSLRLSAGCDPLALSIDPDHQSLWLASSNRGSQGTLLLERSLTDKYDSLGQPVSVLITKRFLTLDPRLRPTAIAAARGAVWVLDSEIRKIIRIDLY
jgi:hypothetical protein